MKLEHAAFIRDAAEIIALLERLSGLTEEFQAASAESAPALMAEIVEPAN